MSCPASCIGGAELFLFFSVGGLSALPFFIAPVFLSIGSFCLLHGLDLCGIGIILSEIFLLDLGSRQSHGGDHMGSVKSLDLFGADVVLLADSLQQQHSSVSIAVASVLIFRLKTAIRLDVSRAYASPY